MSKYKIRFTVTYETTVDVQKGEDLSDVINDIDIPENDTCTYVTDTFDFEDPVKVM